MEGLQEGKGASTSLVIPRAARDLTYQRGRLFEGAGVSRRFLAALLPGMTTRAF
jgi:hypothetical protein